MRPGGFPLATGLKGGGVIAHPREPVKSARCTRSPVVGVPPCPVILSHEARVAHAASWAASGRARCAVMAGAMSPSWHAVRLSVRLGVCHWEREEGDTRAPGYCAPGRVARGSTTRPTDHAPCCYQLVTLTATLCAPYSP